MRFNWLESKVVSMLFFWSVVVCVSGFTYALFIAVPRVRQFFNSSSGNNPEFVLDFIHYAIGVRPNALETLM
jgi:hypothetical protein